MKRQLPPQYLRFIALTALIIGSLISLYCVLNGGRHNSSVLLILLFAVWVLSPFIGLLIAFFISGDWHILTRMTMYWLMIIMTIMSLVCYIGIVVIPNTKPAFIYLITPLVSWFLIFTVIPVASFISKKQLN